MVRELRTKINPTITAANTIYTMCRVGLRSRYRE
jgi:hypothetical protein